MQKQKHQENCRIHQMPWDKTRFITQCTGKTRSIYPKWTAQIHTCITYTWLRPPNAMATVTGQASTFSLWSDEGFRTLLGRQSCGRQMPGSYTGPATLFGWILLLLVRWHCWGRFHVWGQWDPIHNRALINAWLIGTEVGFLCICFAEFSLAKQLGTFITKLQMEWTLTWSSIAFSFIPILVDAK